MGLFDELDLASGDVADRDEILKPPFGWPGGKSKSVNQILQHLPYKPVYVEPFGGSYAVGLCRRPVKLEVCNDRYSGITDFYRCLRDVATFDALVARLGLTVYSREEFQWCKQTWENVTDPIERAARWYYMIQTSFSALGRNFGRALSSNCAVAHKIRDKLPEFQAIHNRLKTVQLENQDWSHCIKDYDSEETVFYIDPPYIDSSKGIYKHELDEASHRELLRTIFGCKGFVALSGYAGNPIIDNNPWSEIFTWNAFISIEPVVNNERNNKDALNNIATRGVNRECLWIKY